MPFYLPEPITIRRARTNTTISKIVGARTMCHGQSMTLASFRPMKSTCNAPRKVIPPPLELLFVLKCAPIYTVSISWNLNPPKSSIRSSSNSPIRSADSVNESTMMPSRNLYIRMDSFSAPSMRLTHFA